MKDTASSHGLSFNTGYGFVTFTDTEKFYEPHNKKRKIGCNRVSFAKKANMMIDNSMFRQYQLSYVHLKK